MKRIYVLFTALCVCCALAAQDIKELLILHTNDTHSRVEPIPITDPNPEFAGKAGFVRRVTLIKEIRKQDKDLLLFDCGDFSQGSPFYNMFGGEVEVKLMNECEGVVFENPIEAAQRVADILKNREKCDLVVCLSHLGWQGKPYSDETLILNTRNIDIVLGGHSHSYFDKTLFYKNLDGKEIPLQQMGKNAVYVGKMKVRMEKN